MPATEERRSGTWRALALLAAVVAPVFTVLWLGITLTSDSESLPTAVVKIVFVIIAVGSAAMGARWRTASGVALLAEAEVTVLHVMSQLPASPVAEDQPTVLDGMSRLPAMPSRLTGHLDDLDSSAEDLMARGTREGKHLLEALDILGEMGISARARVRHGLVVDEVSAEACGPEYDLIAVGAHSAKGWMRWLLDDVTQEIMNACLDRPILVVKA